MGDAGRCVDESLKPLAKDRAALAIRLDPDARRDVGRTIAGDHADRRPAAAAVKDEALLRDEVDRQPQGFTWDPDPAMEAAPNVIRGRYVDASSTSLYQLIDYPEVRIASPDGIDRVFTLDLGIVESVSQAQRIAKQVLQRKQYERRFGAPFDIRAWGWPVGKVVPFTFAPLGFDRTLFRVAEQDIGTGSSCAMVLDGESPDIYAWDADDRPPVNAAAAIVYDPMKAPLVQAINEAASIELVEQQAELIGQQQEMLTAANDTLTAYGQRLNALEQQP